MARLELTRSTEDKQLYVLPGIGELRARRWPSKDVEVTAGGRTYTFSLRGRKNVPTATDAFGEEAGRQDGILSLVWGTSRWDLAPADDLSYYTLTRPGEERAVMNLAPALWGTRPVPVVLDEAAGLDPGLALFALFVMRYIAEGMNRTTGDGGAVGF